MLRVVSVFGAKEQKPLRQVETKQTRQIFRTEISSKVLGNCSSRVPEMFHRIFDDLSSSFSFIFPGAYLPLIVSSSGRKMKAGFITGALEAPAPNKVLLLAVWCILSTDS